MSSTKEELVWRKALNQDELPEGRVKDQTLFFLLIYGQFVAFCTDVNRFPNSLRFYGIADNLTFLVNLSPRLFFLIKIFSIVATTNTIIHTHKLHFILLLWVTGLPYWVTRPRLVVITLKE